MVKVGGVNQATLIGFLAVAFLLCSQCVSVAGLKCYSCNSGIPGQEKCGSGKIKDVKESNNPYIVECNNAKEYEASQEYINYDAKHELHSGNWTAFNSSGTNSSDTNSTDTNSTLSKTLMHELVEKIMSYNNSDELKKRNYVGVFYWGINVASTSKALLGELMQRDLEEVAKLSSTSKEPMKADDNDKSEFVCRSIYITIPFGRVEALKKEKDERVIRTCGIRLVDGKGSHGMDEKKDKHCEIVKAGAQIKINVCTCSEDEDGKPCNGVGKFRGSFLLLGFVLLLGIFDNVLFPKWEKSSV